MNEPVLEKPGAGLPLIERLVARHFIMPKYSKKMSWEESLAQFEREGKKILGLLAPLSREERTQRVLIDRFTGIEDSSRYWSVAMTVEHLMIVGSNGLSGMILLSQGIRPQVEVRIENVKPKGAGDPMAIDAAYAGFTADYVRTLSEKIADRRSKTTLRHPWLGPMTVAQWHWLMASHQGIHRKQIWKIIQVCPVHKGRLEAFSDGVIAIIITIMVLELKIPQGPELSALGPLVPVLVSYAMSFVFIGIYWNNHHHLMQAAQKINGRILWANLHLLFWLSLIPFVTGWMGQNCFSPWPVALYGVTLMLAGAAYFVLARNLVAFHGHDSALASAIGNDFKGKISVAIYLAAIPLAFVHTGLAYALYAVVAVMWLVPDRRIENVLRDAKTH